MCEKKDFFGIDMLLQFGDGTEIEPCKMQMDCTNYRREKAYEKLCKGCNEVTPKSMKSFIEDNFCIDDEPYYCYWCEFIRATEIDALLVVKEKEESSGKKAVKYVEEDDGAAAMWELEDAGAFSDEGIMPGCRSNAWEYRSEMEDIMQEYREMAFVGNCIKIAREKAGLSTKVLADRLQIPESFIEYIESGEYIDDGIKREIADYLLDTLKPDTTGERDKNTQPKVAESNDMLPF